jgi:hypothetical protein
VTRRRAGRWADRAIIWAILLGLPLPAVSWGEYGHRITGEIAELHLDAEARRRVEWLLGGKSLADVAGWADRVRETERYEWTRRLHFVNLPDDATGFEMQRDCPDGECVVQAVARFSQQLGDRELGRRERATALRFLVHFVGDVHQPLHVSRRTDLGGNLIVVTYRNEKKSLHQIWDSTLVGSGDWREHARRIDQSITREQAAGWRESGPRVWADESWSLARSHAYAVPADGVIDADYLQRSAVVVERRLAAAGIRLAGLLNRIFAEQGSQ